MNQRYLLKAGALYAPEEHGDATLLARLRGPLCGTEKTIIAPDGTELCRTWIERDAAAREYRLDARGKIAASARPGYADGEDPAAAGRPLCRAPRMDHADVTLGGEALRLTMPDSRRYLLTDAGGQEALRVSHLGTLGGWSIETRRAFAPGILLGLFVFCRYLEAENEFITV